MGGCGGLPGEGFVGLTMSGIQPSKGSRKNVPGASAKSPRQECSSTGESLGLECQGSTGASGSSFAHGKAAPPSSSGSCSCWWSRAQDLAPGRRSPFPLVSLGKGRGRGLGQDPCLLPWGWKVSGDCGRAMGRGRGLGLPPKKGHFPCLKEGRVLWANEFEKLFICHRTLHFGTSQCP